MRCKYILNNQLRYRAYVSLVTFGLSLCLILTGCATKAVLYKTEAYFSSEGHVKSEIVKAIENSRFSIDIAIFDFTSQPIKVSLEKAADRGVKVRVIADSRQAKSTHSVVPLLKKEGFSVKIAKGRSGGIMHHKFAIFDKTLLFTGSYNWTDNAENHNYENAVFISDPNIIKRYQKEFDIIWADVQQ